MTSVQFHSSTISKQILLTRTRLFRSSQLMDTWQKFEIKTLSTWKSGADGSKRIRDQTCNELSYQGSDEEQHARSTRIG
jgi:hypothetical protein